MKTLYAIALTLLLALVSPALAQQQRIKLLGAAPSNGSGTCAPSTTVGGVAVGSAGTTGIYAGHILSWGDEFDCFSIVGPPSPKGTYFTTELYGGFGRRGTNTLLGTQYDTDQLHTGYNDINRGVPVGWNNLRVSNSTLIMQARQATAREQASAQPTDPSINNGVRAQVGTTVSSAGNIVFYPSTASVILEWRLKFVIAGCCAGWHPDIWQSFATPSVVSVIAGANGNQWNLCEGSTQSCTPSNLFYTNGSFVSLASQTQTALYDGNFHTISIVFVNGANTVIYVDGTAVNTFAFDSNTGGGFPFYWLLTSHVYNAFWDGDNYNAAAWAASGTGLNSGNAIVVDWARVWRPSTAKGHFVPGATISDLLVDYAGSGSIVLPSSASLWPLGATAENVQIAPAEVNEPGNAAQSTYFQFPPGVTYNSGTRTISVNFAAVGGNAGVMHGLEYGWAPDGSTTIPARFTIVRGPNFTTISQGVALNVPISLDMYPFCDVGIATPKTMTMTGLPTGLSFDPASFRVTGTLTTTGTATASCTNNVGQTQTTTFAFTSTGYQGPGDIVAGAQFWYGLRAYNAAYATGSNPGIDVCDGATFLTCTTINILSNGAIDTATAMGSASCVGACYVSEFYDQTGNGHHVTCASTANCPRFIFSCKSAQPCSQANIFGALGLVGSNVTPATGNLTISAVGNRATGTTTINLFRQNGTNNRVNIATANTWQLLGGMSGTISATAADAAWHAANAVINGASSVLNIDGTETTGTATGNTTAGAPGMQTGAASQTVDFMEAGAWDNVEFTSFQRKSMCQNQHTFYSIAGTC